LIARTGLSARLTRFLVVGGSGVLVNTVVLYLLHERAGLPLPIASPMAVELAIINNYLLNDRWTFSRRRPSLARLAKFNLVSLGGLALTTGSLWVLTSTLGMQYLLANLVGIGLATGWNFAANVRWTWARRRTAAAQPLTIG
jgi:putative flippase GtrA